MNNDNELQPSTGEGMQPTIGDVPVGMVQTERPKRTSRRTEQKKTSRRSKR